MSYQEILDDLKNFSGREEDLKKITRYSLYHTMWYRTNLWNHSRRVAWIVKELSPLAKEVFGSEYDEEKAFALALVHDDAETIFGDVQAGNKMKMSKEELDKVKEAEKQSAQTLIKKFPSKVGKFEYKDLLQLALDKSAIESIIVDWADKYDAFGEALHEIFAGNKVWTENVVNQYGKILLPTEYYMNYFNNFENKFPRSQELFQKSNPIFKIPKEPNVFEIVKEGREHTLQSIQQSKNYEPYDLWVKLTLQNGTTEDIKDLYIKKE